MSAIVLFDGVCNFCEGSVNFIIKHDKNDYFKFAPLQSEFAQEQLKKFAVDDKEIDSIILIENGQIYTHSDAALNIALQLEGKWSAPYFLIYLPKIIRDFFYKLFAKYRYKMFGKKDVCMMPTPAIREKFLS